MSDSDKTKTSWVPGEVCASVVAALLAMRRAQSLPTWRVRAAAADLGVSVRRVWRWLEAAESEAGWAARTAATRPAVEVEPAAWPRTRPASAQSSDCRRCRWPHA